MDKAEWYKAVQRFIEAKGIAESNRNLESEFDARTTHVPEIDGWMTVVNMNGGEHMFINREFTIPEWKLMYPESFRGREVREELRKKRRRKMCRDRLISMIILSLVIAIWYVRIAP